VNGREASSIPKMSQYHTPRSSILTGNTGELFDEIRVRQTVETISPNTPCIEATGNRKQFSHSGHRAVKRRVKTCNLRKFWITPAKRFYQFDLSRQMIHIVRADTMQFIY